VPRDDADALGAIKRRIQEERLRVVLTANAALVLLYWDIGRMILERQDRAEWGAKVIDRLAADMGEAFPDMKGFSPRNLKYMRAFASAWPERAIVQEALAQIPWSHNILVLRIDGRAHERQGKAITNFRDTLPPAESDLAAQVFKDPTSSTSSAPPTRAASARSSRRSWPISSASCWSWAPASRSSAGRCRSKSATRISRSTSSSTT
jgi:predicted nuclease of restriction endonuclease-like (RecB) superfamily